MTPEITTAVEQRNGSTTALPQTAAECRDRIRELEREHDDLLLAQKKLDRQIEDAEYVNDAEKVEHLEIARSRLVRQRERKLALSARLVDEVLPALQRSDKTAEASRHLSAATALELKARPVRKSLRDALVEVLKSVRTLDTLRVQHREHENGYAHAHAALQREQHPNVYKHVDLPVGAGMRDHRTALKSLLNALSADRGSEHDAERLADELDRLLLPYTAALPFVAEEED